MHANHQKQMGQDSSIELNMEWISPAVEELQGVQVFGCPTGMPQIDPMTMPLLHTYGPKHPDSQVHGANMGPIWDRQDPGEPHVGPMNIVIRAVV